MPVGGSALGWPADWRPAEGLPVFWGHAQLGGLAVGRLGSVEGDCWTVELGGFDATQPVTVLAR